MKTRRNLSLAPETVELLDQMENASEYVDALVAYARAFGLPEASGLRRAVVERARERTRKPG